MYCTCLHCNFLSVSECITISESVHFNPRKALSIHKHTMASWLSRIQAAPFPNSLSSHTDRLSHQTLARNQRPSVHFPSAFMCNTGPSLVLKSWLIFALSLACCPVPLASQRERGERETKAIRCNPTPLRSSLPPSGSIVEQLRQTAVCVCQQRFPEELRRSERAEISACGPLLYLFLLHLLLLPCFPLPSTLRVGNFLRSRSSAFPVTFHQTALVAELIAVSGCARIPGFKEFDLYTLKILKNRRTETCANLAPLLKRQTHSDSLLTVVSQEMLFSAAKATEMARLREGKKKVMMETEAPWI